MNSTYYTSLSGMMAASYGLQNTSNNVANMHTTGFKRNDIFYSSLGSSGSQGGLGSGVYVGGQHVNYSAGTCLETANPSDLAIVGNGFFIVRLKNNELYYTRSGEFDFNDDGLLIEKHSRGLVQGYNKDGALVPVSQFGPKVSPGQATTKVKLSGEFVIKELDNEDTSDQDPFKSRYMPIIFKVSVWGADGKEHTVTLKYTSPRSTPINKGTRSDNGSNPVDEMDARHWELKEVSCPDADVTIDPDYFSQSIDFEGDAGGAPTHLNIGHIILNGTQKININFYEDGDDKQSSVRLWKKDQINDHVETNITILKKDGYGNGRQIGASFDNNGLISYSYDNGQTINGINVALATFDDLEHTLIPMQDTLFRAKHLNGQHIGRPNTRGMGSIETKKLESANVDSTTEFANIVVLQRMFQACSQIMDIDKQLLEEISKK